MLIFRALGGNPKPAALRILIASLTFAFLQASDASSQGPSGREGNAIPGSGREPFAVGEVERIDGGSIAVKTASGSRTFVLSSRTACVQEAAAGRNDIRKGDRLLVVGRHETGESRAEMVRIVERAGLPGAGRGGGVVSGEVVDADPLRLRSDSGPVVTVLVSGETRYFRERAIPVASVRSGARVRVLAPPQPGRNDREAVKVIVLDEGGGAFREGSPPPDAGSRADLRRPAETASRELLPDLPPRDTDGFLCGIWLGRGLYSREELDRAFRVVGNLGVTHLKVEFKWAAVQPGRGEWRWDNKDVLDVEHLARLAKAHKVSIVPYFDLIAPWGERRRADPERGDCEGPPSGRGQARAPDPAEYAEYVFRVTDKLRREGVDVRHIELDNEESNLNDGHRSWNCFIDITARQIKLAENEAYRRVKAAYPEILVSSTTFSFPGLAGRSPGSADKDRKRRNDFLKAYFDEEPRPLFDFLGLHETLGGSGNPYTTLSGSLGTGGGYAFGSYFEAYDIWRKILDSRGYGDTPIINLESGAVMAGKQDAELIQKFVFLKANAARNKVTGWILSQLTGSRRFTEGGEMGDIRIGISDLGHGYVLREGYAGFYNLRNILARYPKHVGRRAGEPNSERPWVEEFSGGDGSLFVAFVPYRAGKAKKQPVTLPLGAGRDARVTGPDARTRTESPGGDGRLTIEVDEHPVFVEIRNR